jgi:hypothetical protein
MRVTLLGRHNEKKYVKGDVSIRESFKKKRESKRTGVT